jgi:SPP1 gp7 family putative phage head morphogenesis protein
MPNYINLANKGYAEIEKAVKGSQGELILAYKTALNQVRDDLAALYGKYAEKGILSFAEVQKYNRLNGLFDSITQVMRKSKIKIDRITGGAMANAYRESYYLNMYVTEMQTKQKIGFSIIPEKAVEASVNLPQSGLTYIQTISKNFANSLTKVKQTITNGIIRGDSYRTMAGRIKDLFDNGVTDATRVIWTETHRTMIQGSIAAYDEAEEFGVKSRRMWVSTLDTRTRDSHQEMDGVYADEENMFNLPGGITCEGPGLTGYAEEDINCRCRVIAVVSGYEPITRRSKDQGIIEYITYSEWKEKYGI